MANPQESSALDLIRQHLLTDFASMDSLLSNLTHCTSSISPRPDPEFPGFQLKTSTLSQRRPSINVAIPPATVKLNSSAASNAQSKADEDNKIHYRGVRRRPWGNSRRRFSVLRHATFTSSSLFIFPAFSNNSGPEFLHFSW